MREGKNAGEPAFCKKPDSPAPSPAKTLIFSRLTENVPICRVRGPNQSSLPLTPQPFSPAFYLKIPDGVYHGLGFQVEHGEPVHMTSSGGWAGS